MIDASIGVEDHGNIADGTGGGAYINNGKFTMENGHLDYNIGTAGGGGAYINYPNSVTPGEVEITNSTVSYNTTLNNSSNGGGVYVNRGIASIKSSTFIGNEAVGSGGGIYSEGISSVVVVDRLDENSNDCLFQSNSAQNGGGIYARCYSVDVGNTIFDSNTATSNGGGIYVTRSGNNEHATVTLHPETTLIKNEADNSGGGVYVSNGVFTMGDGVTVGGSEENGNKANSTTGNNGGGGIYVTGNASEVNVLGGEISYNTSNRHGGGLYVASTGPDGTNIIGDVLIDHNSAATNGGGGCGGTFAPSLFIGCFAGFLFSRLWNINQIGVYVPEKNFALLGMAGVMSGVMHAPLTGVFLIAELTGGYTMFMPLMIVSVCAYLTIIIFEPHSIYGSRLARQGKLLTHHTDHAVLTLMNLDSVIERDYLGVTPEMELGQIVHKISRSHSTVLPVLDAAGELLGEIDIMKIRNVVFRIELYHHFNAAQLMTEPKARLSDATPMAEVMQAFDNTGANWLPVFDVENRLKGYISRQRIYTMYRKMVADMSED